MIDAFENLTIGWVDMTMIGVLLLSIVVGMVRGLVFEVLSVAGWFAAYFAAQWAAPEVAPQLPVGEPGSPLNLGAAFAATFIVALIVWGIASRVLRWLIRATPLSPIDRLLGGVFGTARAAIVLLVVTTVVGLTPWTKAPAWQQSQGALWFEALLRGIKPVLPAEVSRHLPA